MTEIAPAVFTIPPGWSFVDALARGMMERAGGDPMALSRPLVLLPTRRACRALRDAFLRLSEGRPLLLPRMWAMGEPDEDEAVLQGDLELPPAMPPLRRQLLLARLVMALGGGTSPEQAAQLAGELGHLLDQVRTEGLEFDGLEKLVPAEFAEHWQKTLDFLRILTHHWPLIVEQDGCMDGSLRRLRLLEAQAASWDSHPPAQPVIAAGSTGSIPATAALLAVVARLPGGAVVLPGLDTWADDDSWAAVEPGHPQHNLKTLLDRIAIPRAEVRPWLAEPAPREARARLVSEAMRPAATTEAWRALAPGDPRALDGVCRLDCPGPREEAAAIALAMREALETPGKTAALVTPDRDLARRVAAELRRWEIEVDDSAGQPLHLTAPGVFLRLVARMAGEDFAPFETLSALQHPLAQGGESPGRFRASLRKLDRLVLRGPRPAAGLAGLKDAAAKYPELVAWIGDLERMAAPFVAALADPRVPLVDLVRAHAAFAEALAADHQGPGAQRLWAGEAGEEAAAFMADLRDAALAMPEIEGRFYPGLFDALMSGRMVRNPWAVHPRLRIWGTIEARTQQADLMILGGLNEGVWPPSAQPDPWMSRPMRAQFGLPLPERKLSLSAHDFAQAFCARELILTRAARIEGAPTVPSRWLLRLDTVMRASGLGAWPRGPWIDWAARRDRPDHVEPGRPPAPCPPVSARPRSLSVTQVETWMRDPYAIYARHILGLVALDPIDADPGAADYGDAIHKALERFLNAFPDRLPDDALARLEAIGAEQFREALQRPGVWAFWWPRFLRIAQWFVETETARRPDIRASAAEVRGTLEIGAPGGPFTVTAKADRIDAMSDGSLALIDYKTGVAPSQKEVAAGFAPQLPLEAAIARAGGFAEVPAAPIAELSYWRLKGGEPPGEIASAGNDPETLADEALAGLAGLVAAFDDPSTPYAARPHPDKAPRFSDYGQLARVKEWAALEEEE